MTIGTIIIIVLATIINGLLLKHHIKYWHMQFTLDSQHRQRTYNTDKLYEEKGEKYDNMLKAYHQYIAELEGRNILDQERKPWEEEQGGTKTSSPS